MVARSGSLGSRHALSDSGPDRQFVRHPRRNLKQVNTDLRAEKFTQRAQLEAPASGKRVPWGTRSPGPQLPFLLSQSSKNSCMYDAPISETTNPSGLTRTLGRTRPRVIDRVASIPAVAIRAGFSQIRGSTSSGRWRGRRGESGTGAAAPARERPPALPAAPPMFPKASTTASR